MRIQPISASRLLAAGFVATTIFAAQAAAQETVRASYHYNPKHPAAVHIEKFVAAVNDRSDQIEIQTFPSGQLFGIREQLDAVSSGAVQIGGITGLVSFPPINRNYRVAGIAGMFDSYEEMRDFWAKDPVGQETWKAILSKSNIEILAFNPVGPTLVASMKDICSVEAMKGLNARVLSETDRPLWVALGIGKMVSMPTGEVYTSLQSGLIDTVNTVPAGLNAFSWWEFIKFAQLPYGVYADGYIVANKLWYDSLPEATKATLKEVGAEISKASTAEIMDSSAAILKEFAADHGGTVCTWDEANLKRRRVLEDEVMFPLYAEMVDKKVLDAARAFAAE